MDLGVGLLISEDARRGAGADAIGAAGILKIAGNCLITHDRLGSSFEEKRLWINWTSRTLTPLI
jgi:hypothetical protein